MSRRGELLGLTLLLLAAFAVRCLVSAQAFHGSFDSLTVGVMACDILEGHRPLFFYGQNYMGSLEAYVAAGFFKLFGRSLFTLSLAPIFFSLLWLWTTWLLVRELYGPRAALGAVLVLAVPGWYALWFNLASNGGYPGSFFFGTAAAALAARLWTRRPRGPRLAAPVLGIGLAAGLGLWTNFLAAPWLLLTGAACMVFAFRSARDPWLWASATAGAVLLAAGAWPVLAQTNAYSADPVTQWSWHAGLLALRWMDFLRPGLSAMAFSQDAVPRWWTITAGALLGAGFLQYAVLFFSDGGWRRRLLHAWPLAFLGVFLVLALPHHLAATRAFRYLLPFWSVLCMALFALPIASERRALRRTAAVVLLVWVVLQGGGVLYLAAQHAPRKQAAMAARDRIDAASAALGHPPILVAGDRVLGYRTMNQTFWSGGRSRFASAYDDRNRRIADEVEAAPRHLLATAPAYRDRCENTLRDLGVSFRMTDAGALLLYETDAPPSRSAASVFPMSAQWMPPGQAALPAPELVDRTWDTSLSAPFASGGAIEVQFPRETTADSMVFFSTHPYRDDLPARFRITALDASGNGVLTKEVGPRFTSGYIEDGRVYLKGYFGVLQTTLDGVTAARLRIEPLAGVGEAEAWSIAEVFVFERAETPSPSAVDAWPALLTALDAGDAGFIMAPRVVSAWLNAARPAASPPRAFPRYNPRFADTLGSRFFVPGMTVLVGANYADECRRLLAALYGEAVITGERRIGPWALMATAGDATALREERLVWTGHTLLGTTGPEPPWHLP